MTKKRKTQQSKDVAYQDGTIAIENALPYPIVLYPGFYGAFFAFKQSINDKNCYLCECSKNAITNFISFQEQSNECDYSIRIHYQHYFPKEFLQLLEYLNPSSNYGMTILEHTDTIFKKNLCHYCNLKTPTYAFCIPMYGSKFIQQYGWYVNQKEFDYGINDSTILVEKLPQKIRHLGEQLSSLDEFSENHIKLMKEIKDYAQNSVRIHFGFKKIGHYWTSETTIYNIVSKIYGKNNVEFHYRPKWLDGLEIDIFISSLNIGIEYQGEQHFKAFRHWGGESSFTKRKTNDIKKKKLCEKNGTKLIEIAYNEEITEKLIKERISEFI